MLEHNANHFSDSCSQFLLGKDIPDSITFNLLEIFSKHINTPFADVLQPIMEKAQINFQVRCNAIFNSSGDIKNQEEKKEAEDDVARQKESDMNFLKKFHQANSELSKEEK